MLKADLSTATTVLTDLFETIWYKETIPSDWAKGVIIKLSKKGILQVCDNWCESHSYRSPANISVESSWENQDSYWQDEQSLEWNYPLYTNFIDFKIALTVFTMTLYGRSYRFYGVPPKTVSLIEKFYNHFECSVILINGSSEWFPLKFGVIQGCILSPILFLVVIDWVMRKTTTEKPRDIQMDSLFSQLDDFSFADDLAFLSID